MCAKVWHDVPHSDTLASCYITVGPSYDTTATESVCNHVPTWLDLYTLTLFTPPTKQRRVLNIFYSGPVFGFE